MTFSKKIETNNNPQSNITGEQWDEWNTLVWDSLDVEPFEGKNGKLIKEATEIGVLNFIMEIGSQPNQLAKMKSKVAVPTGDEEYSAEELKVMEERPSNKFFWDTEYRNGEQIRVRKVSWPVDPEEQLVLAFDFPTIKLDYSKHPATNGSGEIKPLRVDYNGRGKGKFKGEFQRTITNEVNWKTGKFGDLDIKYKIATAAGVLDKYQNDAHDLAHLVQATCNWTIRMTKDEKKNDNGEVIATYYDLSIKSPERIQDIKTRKDTYTVAEQLEDAACDVPFCGILMNGGDYKPEDLRQVRAFWWEKAEQAITFDKNEGKEGKDPWIKGLGWEGSDLQKAYLAFKDTETSDKPVEQSKPKPEQPVKEEVKAASESIQEPEPMDFDDDIPFIDPYRRTLKISHCI